MNAVRMLLVGLLVAGVLAGGFSLYRAGVKHERQIWEAKVAELNAGFRLREQQLTAAKHAVEVRYEQLKKTNLRSAADAQSELERLRDTLAALGNPRRTTGADPAPVTRIDAASVAPIERELFGQCAAALVEVARDADTLAAQISGLQDYINRVVFRQ